MLQRIGRGIAQIPDETVHARLGQRNLGKPNPVGGYRQFFWVYRFWFVGTGKAANQSPGFIGNLQGDRPVRFHRVVEHGAVWRILAGRLFRWKRCIGIVVAAHAVGHLRRKKVCIGVGYLCV